MEVIMFGCVTQSNVISSSSHSINACVTNGDLLQLHRIVGERRGVNKAHFVTQPNLLITPLLNTNIWALCL